MIRIATIISFLILSINAKEYIHDLTLEEISGVWELSMFSQFMTKFDEASGNLIFTCSTDITKKCRSTLPDQHAVIKIDHETDTYDSIFTLFPDCNSLEDARHLYPVCAHDGIFPAQNDVIAKGTNISYEDYKLTYKVGTHDSCMQWEIYVEDGKVKVDVEQKCNFEGDPLSILDGVPFVCSDEELQCEVIFDFPITVMKFDDFPVGECTSGNCMNIVDKVSSIKKDESSHFKSVTV